jgi:hypothetical protein
MCGDIPPFSDRPHILALNYVHGKIKSFLRFNVYGCHKVLVKPCKQTSFIHWMIRETLTHEGFIEDIFGSNLGCAIGRL